MKALDVVRTPGGGLAIVTEVGCDGKASITYFKGCNLAREHNAWWSEGPDSLVVLDSIPAVLANAMAHPFGANKAQGQRDFPL